AELVDLYTQALFGVDSSAHVLSSNVNAKALQVAENALTTTANSLTCPFTALDHLRLSIIGGRLIAQRGGKGL
ncbi:hypothetical protein, partial [Vibrio cholerae]|uniref:hypothetical protein n=1 Tax=Vibrio cholerae TaxID=666 RepID=UPI003080BA14